MHSRHEQAPAPAAMNFPANTRCGFPLDAASRDQWNLTSWIAGLKFLCRFTWKRKRGQPRRSPAGAPRILYTLGDNLRLRSRGTRERTVECARHAHN